MQDPDRYEFYKSAAARDAGVYVPKLISLMTWKRNEIVLDYGCGAGSTGYHFILPKVESQGSKMYSIDSSEKMLNHAIQNYKSSNVTYALGNILSQDFPFSNISFDKVFGIHVLHYIKNYRYFPRTLKHEGKFTH